MWPLNKKPKHVTPNIHTTTDDDEPVFHSSVRGLFDAALPNPFTTVIKSALKRTLLAILKNTINSALKTAPENECHRHACRSKLLICKTLSRSAFGMIKFLTYSTSNTIGQELKRAQSYMYIYPTPYPLGFDLCKLQTH